MAKTITLCDLCFTNYDGELSAQTVSPPDLIGNDCDICGCTAAPLRMVDCTNLDFLARLTANRPYMVIASGDARKLQEMVCRLCHVMVPIGGAGENGGAIWQAMVNPGWPYWPEVN